jgi:hypothetical protein
MASSFSSNAFRSTAIILAISAVICSQLAAPVGQIARDGHIIANGEIVDLRHSIFSILFY